MFDINRNSSYLGTVGLKDEVGFTLTNESRTISNQIEADIVMRSKQLAHLGKQSAEAVKQTVDGRLTVVGTSSDIDLSGMPSGVYLLQVGKEVIKVIKK